MLHITTTFGSIAFFLLLVVTPFVLYKYFRYALTSPEPSGPGAIGRGVGALLLADLLGSQVVTFICNLSQSVLTSDPSPLVDRIGVTSVFCLSAFAAGYIAARTVEDTRSMNYKIMCALGIVPHGIIGFIWLSGGLLNHVAFWSYIPLVILGGHLKSRQYSHSQTDGQVESVA